MTLEEQHRIELMRAKKDGFKEGFKDGFAKGFEDGYSEAVTVNIVKKMKEAGLNLQVIASCTGLTIEQVEKL